jgi:hypothetical protein
MLGSGRACRKRKFSLGKRKSKKRVKILLLGSRNHVGKENSVFGSGRAKGGKIIILGSGRASRKGGKVKF